MLKRTPIRRVSVKRKQALVEYRRRRLRFLSEHPFCMVWLAENGIQEGSIWPNGRVSDMAGRMQGFIAPRSTEIHHTKKPKATYLNDESTWLAVCREMHEKIEQNKSWAREKGYLQNI